MTPDFDVIIVGSGPAGVSAAFPLRSGEPAGEVTDRHTGKLPQPLLYVALRQPRFEQGLRMIDAEQQ